MGTAKRPTDLDLVAATFEADGACEAVLTLPLGAPKLLMAEVVQRVVAATMIRSTPGGARASSGYGAESRDPCRATLGNNRSRMVAENPGRCASERVVAPNLRPGKRVPKSPEGAPCPRRHSARSDGGGRPAACGS